MKYEVDVLPKQLREALCLAQTRMLHGPNPSTDRHYVDNLQKLIDECDRHRPLGSDGKHGNRHTPTCGCDVVFHLRHPDGYPSCWPMDKTGDFLATNKDEDVGCPACVKLIEEDNEVLKREAENRRW